MADNSANEKKTDLSSLPRAAISMKGLPIGRSTRLPSIRSPRDLTLGTAPKRTFIPNIPPRRERKQEPSADASQSTEQESSKLVRKKDKPKSHSNEKKFKDKKVFIQTEGSVFGEGIAGSPSSRKERTREAYQKSDRAPAKRLICKTEAAESNVSNLSSQLDNLFRDDFIDHSDDDADEISELYKPTIFPESELKKDEPKLEEIKDNFKPKMPKDVGFDVNGVPTFIKKEAMETEEPEPDIPINTFQNDIRNLLNSDKSQLLLLEIPEVFTKRSEREDPTSDNNHSQAVSPSATKSKETVTTSLSSLPEGHVGKIQVLKSGQTRLVIGSLTFTLRSVCPLKTRYEVVSVKTNSGSGDLSVLGYTGHKLIFSPEISNLIPNL